MIQYEGVAELLDEEVWLQLQLWNPVVAAQVMWIMAQRGIEEEEECLFAAAVIGARRE